MASPWLQGIQVGANIASDAMNRNLRMQQLRSEDAMRRVNERAAVQQMDLLLQKRADEIQYQADIGKAVSAAQLATSPMIPMPLPNGGTIQIANPNPLSKEDAAFRFLLPPIAKRDPDAAVRMMREIAVNQFAPKSEAVTLPSGEVVEGIRTSPNQFTPVIQPKIQNVTNEVTGQTTPILRTGTSGARPLPQDIEGRQQRTMMAKWALENAPELMVVNDEGIATLPPENFNEAARRSGLSTSFRTQMTEQIQGAAGAFEVGRKLLPLLTPENVGVRGLIGRKMVESGLAQFFPGMKVGSATETLSVASNFRAGLVRALRSDGNINKDEREQIIEGLPTPDQFLSSVQDSKIKLATQLELAATKSRAAANALGRPITPFFLLPNEIEQMIMSGQLTGDQAAQMWNQNAWNLIDSIRKEVQR